MVRGERGRLQVFRNTCRRRPHALLTLRKGHLRSAIHCASHSLTYGFDGRLVAGATPGDLVPLEMLRLGPLIFARAGAHADAGAPRAPWEAFAKLAPRSVADLDVAADWKIVVEQWLESPQPQQHFVAPNLLLELRPEGALMLQVTPLGPGRSRIRRFDFAARQTGREAGRAAHDGLAPPRRCVAEAADRAGRVDAGRARHRRRGARRQRPGRTGAGAVSRRGGRAAVRNYMDI